MYATFYLICLSHSLFDFSLTKHPNPFCTLTLSCNLLFMIRFLNCPIVLHGNTKIEFYTIIVNLKSVWTIGKILKVGWRQGLFLDTTTKGKGLSPGPHSGL